MKKQTEFFSLPSIQLFGLILFIALAGGWVANLAKLIGMLDGSVTTMFIIRIVGVFAAPIGAVIGYF